MLRPWVTMAAQCETIGCLVVETKSGFSEGECASYLSESGWYVGARTETGARNTFCPLHKPAHSVQDVR